MTDDCYQQTGELNAPWPFIFWFYIEFESIYKLYMYLVNGAHDQCAQ